VCNADEGEPGTFKDRVLLEAYPELLIEGMIIAGYAIGAKQGIIYLRAEYRYLAKKIKAALKNYRDHGYLGGRIDAREDFEFDIRIQLGAGAYVCGEETALLHSMEGKRGEPGTKEYFPVERGYLGKPTVVNNVETLCAVPRILNMGVDQWLELGTEKSPGTKLLSVSGDCAKPGIYEIEWGMNMRTLIDLMGAEQPYMIQFSGPSGTSLSEADFDRDICREDLVCGGSVMVFNKTRNLLQILKSYSNFFVEESCGICVPCRTGNFLLNKKIDKLILGHGEKKDLEDIKEWSHIIKTTSRCGLGTMSSNSLEDIIRKFPEVFKKSISDNTDFNKAFNLETATQDYDSIINEMMSDYE
ncbi:MAG: NADP oxidoreductase, partial [Flavobacteriaceae bacterium]|nr:NADP oxidoreductase [Flavobacteriaceae bacterium]